MEDSQNPYEPDGKSCNAPTKSCRKCGFRYPPRREVDPLRMTACPECQEPRPCRQRNLPDRGGRCRFHGGASLAGREHPNFRHGGRSKYLPVHLAGRYQEAVEDPQLMELRGDAALLEVRLTQLLSEAVQPDWRLLHESFLSVRRAAAAGDVKGMTRALDELRAIIERGFTEEKRWEEIGRITERRVRLIRAENQRLSDLQLTISQERLTILMAHLVNVIQDGLRELLAAGTPPPAVNRYRARLAAEIRRLLPGAAQADGPVC